MCICICFRCLPRETDAGSSSLVGQALGLRAASQAALADLRGRPQAKSLPPHASPMLPPLS